MSQGANRPVDGEDCAECNRLWELFAEASAELVQLVEEKYSTDRRAQALLDQSIRQAIDKRQRAKQEILTHERDRHAKGGECAVCGGSGKVRQEAAGATSYTVCAHCHGSGITRVSESSSGE